MFRGSAVAPPGTVLINVNFYDNPWFPDTLRRDMEYDARRDPDKYAHIWLGGYLQHSDAKVFKNWRICPFEAPPEAVFRFGADWGFATDPTVLAKAFIGKWSGEPWFSDPIADPFGRVLFVIEEAYEVGCPVDELPALFAGDDAGRVPGTERWTNPRKLKGVAGAHRWKIVADSARPEHIDHLNRRGFRVEGAVKGPGSLEEGVTFLQNYDIAVHPDCIHVADELTHYSYKIDKLTEEVLPELADKDNHTIDALRYALEAVRKAGTGKSPTRSAGSRVTLATDDQRIQADLAKVRALTSGQPEANGGGKGWGSAPGFRQGLTP
jgi:phage terminase large subunit